jgi:hypothetical protein
MPNLTSVKGTHLTAEQMIAVLPGGIPPRGSKLAAPVWRIAATLFERHSGNVRLRMLCSECGVSHRTAWRMRETFRDAAQLVMERRMQHGIL